MWKPFCSHYWTIGDRSASERGGTSGWRAWVCCHGQAGSLCSRALLQEVWWKRKSETCKAVLCQTTSLWKVIQDCTSSQHSLLVLAFVLFRWPQSPSFGSFCPSRQWGRLRWVSSIAVIAWFSLHWTRFVWFKLPTQNPTTSYCSTIIIVIITIIVIIIITTTGSLVSSNWVKMFKICLWGKP